MAVVMAAASGEAMVAALRGGYGGMESFGRTPLVYARAARTGATAGASAMEAEVLPRVWEVRSITVALGFLQHGAGRYHQLRRRGRGPGPGGGVAGRGAYGVEGTTAGGRSYADVGRRRCDGTRRKCRRRA